MRNVYHRSGPPESVAYGTDDIHKHIDELEGLITRYQDHLKETALSLSAALKVTFSGSGRHEPTEKLLEKGKVMLAEIVKRTGSLIRFNGQRSIDTVSRTIAANRLKKVVGIVEGLPAQLRTYQRQYDNHLKSTEYVPLDKLFSSGASAPNVRAGAGKDEQLLSASAEAEIEMATIDANERYDEIVKIAKSATELSQMFNELSVIVGKQGEMLDRIDSNMDSAVANTVAGKNNVETASKYQKKNNCCVVTTIVLLLLITIMIIIIIVKSQN